MCISAELDKVNGFTNSQLENCAGQGCSHSYCVAYAMRVGFFGNREISGCI